MDGGNVTLSWYFIYCIQDLPPESLRKHDLTDMPFYAKVEETFM